MDYSGKVKVKRENPNNILIVMPDEMYGISGESETEKPNNINPSSSSLGSMEYLGKVVVFELCRIL